MWWGVGYEDSWVVETLGLNLLCATPHYAGRSIVAIKYIGRAGTSHLFKTYEFTLLETENEIDEFQVHVRSLTLPVWYAKTEPWSEAEFRVSLLTPATIGS